MVQLDCVSTCSIKEGFLDTAHCLVKINEQKIAQCMKEAPCIQNVYDGTTLSGVHYVRVFASFAQPYMSVEGRGNFVKKNGSHNLG